MEIGWEFLLAVIGIKFGEKLIMKPETEQLLGTLEVLVWHPHPSRIFVWETEEQGELNVWNLAIAEGFVSLSDVDVAIAYWQSVERWGTPTDRSIDYEYAPPRNERQDGWNAEIETKRFETYQQLSQLLKAELQDLQAFKLSIPKNNDSDFEWHHPDYCFYIIIGKTNDENWLCFSPTVPDQVTYNFLNQIIRENQIKSPSNQTLELQSRIKSILAELQPIQLYGYYYGAYNYTYQHNIIYTISQEKALAIELALQSAGMLRIAGANSSLAIVGAILGIVGALVGAYGGRLVRIAAIARIGAVPAALAEDLIAIGLAAFIVTR